MNTPVTAQPPDVFISYAREDRATAQALALALQAQGLSAWWDREIPLGRDFAEVIGENLQAARLACVLWSPEAVASSFVRDEAGRARDANKLLPVRIAEVTLPLGFGTLQTLDLIDWDGAADHPACEAVVAEIRRALGQGRVGGEARSVSSARTLRHPRWLPWLGLAAVLLASLAWGGWQVFQAREARFHLGEGLQAQFARDPNLEAARTAYLFALEADPDLASAHYYLGHVYAQLDERDAAREQFLAALQIGEGLDGDQRREAEQLLRTLDADAGAPAALGSSAVAVAPTVPPTTAQAPTATTPPPPAAGPMPTAPATPPSRSAPVNLAQLSNLAERVPPAPALARDVQSRVEALFSADPQARLNAGTALALAPGLNAEAVPLAVERALAGLARAPGDAAVRGGVHATLVLLQNASAMSLAFGRGEIGRLLQQAAPLSPTLGELAGKVSTRLASATQRAPIVFLQIAAEAQRPIAQALARRLAEAGYESPSIELVSPARAPSRSEIRAQGSSHLGLGRWQAKQVQELSGEAPTLVVLRKADPAVDTYELWLDKDLCVAPDRRVSGCGS